MKKNHTRILFIALIMLLFINGSIHSQVIKGANGSETQMKKFDQTAKKMRQLTSPSKSVLSPDFPIEASPNNYFSLMFDRTLDQEQEKLLTNNGISFLGLIGNNTYLLKTINLDKSLKALAKALSTTTLNILGISEVPSAFKIKSTLYDYVKKGEEIPLSKCSEGIYVTVFDASDLSALKKTLTNWSVAFNENTENTNSLIVTINDALMLNRIAEIPYVYSIEERTLPTPESSAFNMGWITKPNQIAAVNYDMNGPIGRGVFFGNWETFGAIDDFAVSYRGREIAGKSDRTDNGHGTNITLIVGGANNINEFEGQGMAPGVQILGMNDAIKPSFAAGVSPNIAAGYSPLVSNHSVGWTTGDVAYSASSAELDMATYANPSFIMSYSSGNSGATGKTYAGNVFPDYSSITGSIKTNKNNLTVHGNLNVAENSTGASFGPTSDGRLKPDISAEGSGGTSYAAPGVTGMAAVLLEVYRDTYGTPERSDVVKAVMLNTAIDMTNKGIDFVSGFGQINPSRAVNAIRLQNLKKNETIPQGNAGVVDYQLEIPAGVADARVLLYWHDYPGTAGAAKALVNDLDLEVIDPVGTKVLPWVLDATPANVKNLPLQKRDSLNNVEQVTFENPVAGIYTIRVKGKSVTRGPQKFVVTWELKSRSLKINSHPEGYKLSKAADLFISWDLTAAPGIAGKVVDIYFRANNLAAWTKVATATSKLYYKWAANALPAFMTNLTTTSTAQFKLVCEDLESISGNCQYMNTPQNLKLDAFCSTQATLSWTPLANFNGKYIVYSLGNNYMEPVDTVNSPITQSTIFPVQGKTFDKTSFFAIAARDEATGALSLRSIPVTADPSNTSVDGVVFSKDNYLCYGDTIIFQPNVTNGIVTYFKNNVAMANQNVPLKLSRNDLGSYAYQLNTNGCTWKSDAINIYSGTVDIADTLQVGNFAWKASVFRGGNATWKPLYGAKPLYYGKYELDKLSFDSNVDIVPWAKTQNNAIGYTGCPFPDTKNTTVLKRKGFAKGNYNIVLKRGSLKFRITIVKNNVVLFNYTAADNYSGTLTIKSNIALDADCEARIEWYGDHLVLDFVRQGVSVIPVAPGNIKTGLAIWIDPSLAVTDATSTIQYMPNAIPQNTLMKPDRPTAKVIINKVGMNFNPTLQFASTGGLQGGVDVLYSGNSVSDFGVFKINTPSPKSWSRVFSAGKSGTKDWDHKMSYVSMEQNGSNTSISTMRKGALNIATNTNIGTWHALQVQYNAANIKIANRGNQITTIATAVDSMFNINKYSVGASFPITESGEMTGQVAEMIHYNRIMTTAEEKKINTYMALKYGLTLTHEYINASDLTIMPIETVYKYNVAGVVCDSVQNLIQKQSKSEETTSTDILAGSLGSIAESNTLNLNKFVANNTFMIWSHNGKSLTINPTTQNVLRTWKLQAVQNKQSLQLNFRKTGVPTNSNAALTPSLILSDNEDLSTESIYPLQEYTAGDGIKYLSAEIQMNQAVKYFTVGYRITNGFQNALNNKSKVVYDKKSKNVLIETQLDAVRLEIVSFTGTITANQALASKSARINVQNYPAGGYIVRIIQENGMSSNHKVIIHD